MPPSTVPYALSQLASAAFGGGQSCTGRSAGHCSELFHLGVEETLAPQIDRLEIGWTKEARDVGRRLLPVDVPDRGEQRFFQPRHIDSDTLVAGPRARLKQSVAQKREVGRHAARDVPGEVEPVATLEEPATKQRMDFEGKIGRKVLVSDFIVSRKIEICRRLARPQWWIDVDLQLDANGLGTAGASERKIQLAGDGIVF